MAQRQVDSSKRETIEEWQLRRAREREAESSEARKKDQERRERDAKHAREREERLRSAVADGAADLRKCDSLHFAQLTTNAYTLTRTRLACSHAKHARAERLRSDVLNGAADLRKCDSLNERIRTQFYKRRIHTHMPTHKPSTHLSARSSCAATCWMAPPTCVGPLSARHTRHASQC